MPLEFSFEMRDTSVAAGGYAHNDMIAMLINQYSSAVVQYRYYKSVFAAVDLAFFNLGDVPQL